MKEEEKDGVIERIADIPYFRFVLTYRDRKFYCFDKKPLVKQLAKLKKEESK